MKKKWLIQHFYITCDFVYSLAMKISNNINSEKSHIKSYIEYQLLI